MVQIKFRFTLLFLFSLLLAACTSPLTDTEAPPAVPPTITITLPPEPPPPMPTEIPQAAPPTDTPAITDEPASPQSLSEEGPWLIIITPEGLWIVNENGTGLTQLTDRRVFGPQDITVMPSPGGGFIAYLTSREIYKDLTLNILAIPRGLAQTIPLVAPEFQPPEDASPGDPPLEAVRALIETTSLAWAPDGTKLAFMGMMDGPSSDLYVWDTDDFYFDPDTIPYVRLTDGPSQGITPVWSPDGQYIVHGGVSALGTGAGYSFTGVWAARADNTDVLDLYVPEASGDERVIGWVDDATFLVASWSPSCGTERLRTFNIETRETRSVWDAPFNGVAFDPQGGGLLFALDQFTADCSGIQPGLYFLPSSFAEPIVLTTEETFLPVWDPAAGLFFARTVDTVVAIRRDGAMINLRAPEPLLPIGASDGSLAWASPISGVWITNLDQPPRQIHPSPAFVPAWSANGDHLFFFAEEGMYVAHAPEFIPELSGEGLESGGVFWLASGAEK